MEKGSMDASDYATAVPVLYLYAKSLKVPRYLYSTVWMLDVCHTVMPKMC